MRGPKLRIGVVGLGRLWEARHRPALTRLADRFEVVAVYDQVARRAEIEAHHLRCATLMGLRALIERPDVDAVYLMAPQWFGLLAVELAGSSGKPVYFALPPAGSGLEDLLSRNPSLLNRLIAPELARRFYPATLRLHELLATKLGSPRLVIGQSRLLGFDRYGPPGPSTQVAPNPLRVDPCGYLLDWCLDIFRTPPVAIQAHATCTTGETEPDYLGFNLDFSCGGMAQIGAGRYHRAEWGDATRFLPSPGFQVFAERGVAWLEMPDRIHWSDVQGVHEEKLPLEPSVGELLNDQFYRRVRGEPSLSPGLADALIVERLVKGLEQSLAEGRRVRLCEPRTP